MTLTDDVVELFERHMKAPYRARLESCPYSFERSETGQMYRVASIEHAYQLFAAGYAARAALEAARYGEMRECLRECLEQAIGCAENHYGEQEPVYGAHIVKARALLSIIGEPNPDLGATQL